MKTAFLNGNLRDRHVCKLNKGIYGLKQAAKVWNDKLNEILKQLVFYQSEADLCLYIKTDTETPIYLTVYVDDILIVAKPESHISQEAVFVRNIFLFMN